MDKSTIRNFAIEARKILMKSAVGEAGLYGITKDGCKPPVQKGNDFEIYETIAGTQNRIFGADIKKRANLEQAIEQQGFEQVIEETAYTWFNRIIAIRFMEVNNYLPSRVRVLSSETGSNTPDIVAQSDTVDLNMTEDELQEVREKKNDNKYDDAFRQLFVKQCNELNAILPGLFEKTNDYMELLLKLSYTGDGVVRMLVDTIPEDNFNVETEGQVEIIGWMYQYYNTELKDDTFAKLKKNIKITKERIPAATQLFTPDWIVRYMVENSVGRVWIEHLRAVDSSVDEKAKAEEFGWKYYLPEAEQDAEVTEQLVQIRKDYANLEPKDISCIDPCMGSGHILVYMFDVLMDIYRSEGYNERDAVFDILQNNIHGLDIDRRAYQLSYFALMMKARGYNRLFFRGCQDENMVKCMVYPNVFAIEESNGIKKKHLEFLGSSLNEIEKSNALHQLNGLIDSLYDAKEYGSILNVNSCDWELLEEFVSHGGTDGQLSFDTIGIEDTQKKLLHLIKQGRIMAARYKAVATNPPYMGGRNMSSKVSDFVKKHYEAYKADLFSAFVAKCSSMTEKNGFTSFLTPYVWMFIQSYEKMREMIYNTKVIESLIQFEYSAFEEATVPICTFTIRNEYIDKNGRYIRLSDFRGGMEVQRQKVLEALGQTNCNYMYFANARTFKKIPTAPVSYWLDKEFVDIFGYPKLGEIADSKQGIATANNNVYLRLWYEVEISNINFSATSHDDSLNAPQMWYPYNKGGEFRKWYGNNDYVVNWKNDGKVLKQDKKAVLRNQAFYFRESASWSDITSGTNAFRYKQPGQLFDVSGMSFFSQDRLFYLLALCNTKIVKEILKVIAPTMHCQCGDVANIPVIIDETKIQTISQIAEENIKLSKLDWDAFEVSWDFKRHPLIPSTKGENVRIENMYKTWSLQCESRFDRVKENEEKLNDIFIKMYGLEDVLDSNIEDAHITIHKANKKRDIKSLLSYIIGCIMGRYNVNYDGLYFAGGKWCEETVDTSVIDVDGIIPITDTEYFDDDIVSQVIKFIGNIYGLEYLDENLCYIANAIDCKGVSSKEILRSYLLNEFYKDHCDTYSVSGSGKRPIYWMFDSGKQNGFKCLVYLHRYNKDTIGVIRTDYLTKTQNAIENALKNAEYVISTSGSAVDKAQATKQRDKYIKQLAEIRTYYQALSHVAQQRIELDLDDGVKVNYAKFQGIEVSIEGEKKQTINLLAKI